MGERQNCCAPAREADVATVAAGMRRLRRDGYLAAARMLAHDDIHRWLADYRGRLSVWCGEQDAITQPELVQEWRCVTAPLHRHPSGWTCQLSR